MDPIRSKEIAFERLELEEFHSDNGTVSEQQNARSFRVTGADVPGIFLSIARVFAADRANIAAIQFSGYAPDVGKTVDTSFEGFNYFSGDVWVDFERAEREHETGLGEEKLSERIRRRCLDLRFNLLNLLGVEGVRVQEIGYAIDALKSRRGLPGTSGYADVAN